MFKFFPQSPWTQEDFHNFISFVRGDVLLKEMQETTDLQNPKALKVNREYPIYKSVGGVKIEAGALLLYPVLLKETLILLDDFFIQEKGHREVRQNLEALGRWALRFGWPVPDPQKCEGYILNCEMVRFSADDKGSVLIFKYKDRDTDTFFLYNLWFLLAERSYFFLISKSF